jgi:branched-chain amino acid transport system permease protein
MLGGLTVGLIEVFAGYYLGAQFQQAAYFFVFILILMLRPSGFLRR